MKLKSIFPKITLPVLNTMLPIYGIAIIPTTDASGFPLKRGLRFVVWCGVKVYGIDFVWEYITTLNE